MIFAIPEYKNRIVIAPFPRQDQKRCWDKWSKLCDALGNILFDECLLLIGNEENWDEAEQIIEQSQNKDISNLCGCLSTLGLGMLLKECRLLICVNSMPMHLAAALGVNRVAIIGGTPANVVVQEGDPTIRYIEDPGLALYDPETTEYPVRINDITVEQVLEKIKELTDGKVCSG